MPDILDPLDLVLNKHADSISVLESKMAELSGKSVDPTRLQGVLERVEKHTQRLQNLLQMFPPPK